MRTPLVRTVRSVAVLGVAALALSACGPDTSGGSDDNGGDQGGDVDLAEVEPADEITFWTNHPGGSQDVENELIEAFTAETGITVNVVTSGANYEETSQRFQTAQGSAEVDEIGRASCRERGEIWEEAVAMRKKRTEENERRETTE